MRTAATKQQTKPTSMSPEMCEKDEDDWDPQPAQLRDGEHEDLISHAQRNLEVKQDLEDRLSEDEE